MSGRKRRPGASSEVVCSTRPEAQQPAEDSAEGKGEREPTAKRRALAGSVPDSVEEGERESTTLYQKRMTEARQNKEREHQPLDLPERTGRRRPAGGTKRTGQAASENVIVRGLISTAPTSPRGASAGLSAESAK